MSAFEVSDRHISYLLRAAREYRAGEHARIASPYDEGQMICAQYVADTDLGQMLVNENSASVNHRYRDECGEPHLFCMSTPSALPAITPAQVIKACDCYMYQACEHPGWKESDAERFVTSIRERAIDRIPGYDQAEWSL